MRKKYLLERFKLPEKVSLVIDDEHENSENKAVVCLEPFERGFATTIGNSLRRTLLSSIQGFAVTALKISVYNSEGGHTFINSEYDCIDGIKDDVIDIFDNIKQLKFKVSDDVETTMHFTLQSEFKGSGECKASVFENSNVEVVNKDKILFTAVKDIHLMIELDVELGRGYVPAEESERRSIEEGVIPVDVVFSPIENVSVDVSNVRIGHRNDYEKLEITIITDGTIKVVDAVAEAAKILKDIFTPLINFDELLVQSAPKKDEKFAELEIKLNLPVEELELSQRSDNCLKAAKIMYLKDLVKLTERDVANLPNFGTKSMSEVKEKLQLLGLNLGMQLSESEIIE